MSQASELSAASTASVWQATSTLCHREVVRFFRQRNRVIGALGQPILFWLLFGAGLDRSFRLADDNAGVSFLEYYFPGTLMLVVLFTAIFATISIIEDRREGFLQAVLVAPIPRISMVLGKILGATLIAVGQGVLFLALGFLFRWNFTPLNLLLIILLMTVSAVAMTSLGFVIAWRMESTQGFHAIMNLLLMPMWLLSGAFFPVPAVAAGVSWSQWILHWAMRLNPVTYAVSGVRQLLHQPELPVQFYTPTLTMCWIATTLFAVVMLMAAQATSAQRTAGDLL